MAEVFSVEGSVGGNNCIHMSLMARVLPLISRQMYQYEWHSDVLMQFIARGTNVVHSCSNALLSM